MFHGVTDDIERDGSIMENKRLPVNTKGQKMLTIGDRLREERERLGMTQTEFGALAGVTKATQINYETGRRAPDAGYLAAVAGVGLDVQFVVIGQRVQDANESSRHIALLSEAWEALEQHYQSTGTKLTPEKKRQAAEALYKICLERGGLQANRDIVSVLAAMSA